MLESQLPDRSVCKLWIKEVEKATSIDDPMTSQSVEGKVFPEFEMLDARVASERAQKQDRFQRGRILLK